MIGDFKYMVFTSCATYNHENYIVDTMKGFIMQQTKFPVVYCIIDDASTDNNPSLIESYVKEYFTFDVPDAYEKFEEYGHEMYARHKSNENCWFVVILLNENHYSKKKSKLPYLTQWRSKAKYYAICEGDDYWIDARKLQKQVDILENHPGCTMVCNRTKLHSVRRDRIIGEQYCLNRNDYLDPKDVIRRGGLYISTCSILYRTSIMDNYPDYCRNCLVGDYPLQIYCAMKGRIYYLNDIMSVYRIENNSSWMGTQKWGTINEQRLKVIASQVQMFKGFSRDYLSYERVFEEKVVQHIIWNMPFNLKGKILDDYLLFFNKYIQNIGVKWKLIINIRKNNYRLLQRIVEKIFFSKFINTKTVYK